MTAPTTSPPGPGLPAPAVTRATARPRSSDTIVRSVGLTLTLLAVLILGFVGYLYFLSGVQEARAQTTLYATMRGELGLAVAPTGPVIPGHPASPASLAAAPGDPVALLSVPAIGITNMVIVEGTCPENLTAGPGHLRDTPLPGQAGVSVVFGRRATFGAPFEQPSAADEGRRDHRDHQPGRGQLPGDRGVQTAASRSRSANSLTSSCW